MNYRFYRIVSATGQTYFAPMVMAGAQQFAYPSMPNQPLLYQQQPMQHVPQPLQHNAPFNRSQFVPFFYYTERTTHINLHELCDMLDVVFLFAICMYSGRGGMNRSARNLSFRSNSQRSSQVPSFSVLLVLYKLVVSHPILVEYALIIFFIVYVCITRTRVRRARRLSDPKRTLRWEAVKKRQETSTDKVPTARTSPRR